MCIEFDLESISLALAAGVICGAGIHWAACCVIFMLAVIVKWLKPDYVLQLFRRTGIMYNIVQMILRRCNDMCKSHLGLMFLLTPILEVGKAGCKCTVTQEHQNHLQLGGRFTDGNGSSIHKISCF